MAGPVQRVKTVIAAATQLWAARSGVAGIGTPEQERAWHFARMAEPHNAIDFISGALSKLRLYVGLLPADGDGPPERVDDPNVTWVLEILRSPAGGYRDILRAIAANLTVAGECYLVGITNRKTGERDRWEVASVRELEYSSGKWILLGQPNKAGVPEKFELDITDEKHEGMDVLWRVHVPSADRSWVADSPMLGCLDVLEQLELYEKQLRSATLSRIVVNGILAVAQELDLTEVLDNEQDRNEPQEEPVISLLKRAGSAAMRDAGSPAAALPVVIRPSSEFIKEKKAVEFYEFNRKSDEALVQNIETTVVRYARGMSLPVEVVTGLMSTTFANAAMVDEDTWKAYLEPPSMLMVDALTVGFLHPMLEDAGVVQAKRYVLWYDESEVVAPVDTMQKALDVFDRDGLSWTALRREADYPDSDGPSLAELELRSELKAAARARPVTPQAEPSLPPPTTPGQPPASLIPRDLLDAYGREQAAAAGTAAPGNGIGRRLLELDRDLRVRLRNAAERDVHRVIAAAGNRVRTRARRDPELAAMLNVPPDEVTSTLGRGRVSALGYTDEDLVHTSFTQLARRFRGWAQEAQDEVLRLFNVADREDLRNKQERYRVDAEAWLEQTLERLAVARLYRGSDVHAASTVGPAAYQAARRDLVPEGVARAATQVAGGAGSSLSVRQMAEEEGDFTFELFVDEQGAAVGGVGSGVLTQEIMRDVGRMPEGFIWVHGDSAKPFEPHLDLDGETVENYDDPLLENPDDYPDSPFYYPGDHAGCSCSLEMIIPDEEVAAAVPFEVVAYSEDQARDEHGRFGEGGGNATQTGSQASDKPLGPGKVSAAELSQARAIADQKFAAAPQPTEADRQAAEARHAQSSRQGGDDRGSSRDRAASRANLLKQYGNGKTCPCIHCGQKLTNATLSRDRLIPGIQGGRYRLSNLAPACGSCNSSRGDTPYRPFGGA